MDTLGSLTVTHLQGHTWISQCDTSPGTHLDLSMWHISRDTLGSPTVTHLQQVNYPAHLVEVNRRWLSTTVLSSGKYRLFSTVKPSEEAFLDSLRKGEKVEDGAKHHSERGITDRTYSSCIFFFSYNFLFSRGITFFVIVLCLFNGNGYFCLLVSL